MRTRNPIRSVVAMTTVFLMLLPGMAFADTVVVNDVDTNGNVSRAAGASATAKAWIMVDDNSTDPVNGCNASGSNPVTITLTSNSSVVTVETAPQQVTNCGSTNGASFSYKIANDAAPGAVATLTATASGGRTNNDGVVGKFTSGSFTVTVSAPAKQNQTIDFAQPTTPYSYGDTFSVAPTASSDLPVTLEASGSCSAYGFDVTMTSGSGTCTLTASQGGNASYNAATNVVRTVAAQPRAITVTADAKSKVFGEDDPALTYQVTSGSLVDGDSLTGALARVSGSNVGQYDITKGSLEAGNNYNLTFVGAKLTITKASATITISDLAKTYNGSAQGATITTSPANLSGLEVKYDDSATVPTHAGSYTVVATLDNANYQADPASESLVIAKKRLTGSFAADDKTYDGTTTATIMATSRQLDGVVAGDTVSLTGGSATFASKNVGTHAVTGSGFALAGTDMGNYELGAVTASNARITARELTVTATGEDKEYDGSDSATVTLSTDKLSSDAVTANSTSATFGDKNVGTAKTVTVTGISISGADAGNYRLINTTAETTGNITQRPITVTADAKSKVYGDDDPALTYQVTAGSLVQGDALAGSLSRLAGENVGAWTITQGNLSAGLNYALTFVDADLTITARPITVTADTKNKTLGASDPTLTYRITSGSLVSGDSLSGALTRDAGETVGSYPIRQGTLTAGTNYDLAFVGANLTITYNFTGFFRPVEMGSVLNQVKAGQAVPVKFSLGGNQGLNIMAPGFPKAQTITCDTNAPIDLVEETVTAGSSSLSYDATSGQYHYVWKTDKSWTGCRQLQVKFIDGQTYTANFKLTK